MQLFTILIHHAENWYDITKHRVTASRGTWMPIFRITFCCISLNFSWVWTNFKRTQVSQPFCDYSLSLLRATVMTWQIFCEPSGDSQARYQCYIFAFRLCNPCSCLMIRNLFLPGRLSSGTSVKDSFVLSMWPWVNIHFLFTFL